MTEKEILQEIQKMIDDFLHFSGDIYDEETLLGSIQDLIEKGAGIPWRR
jgi:hypothetical protein